MVDEIFIQQKKNQRKNRIVIMRMKGTGGHITRTVYYGLPTGPYPCLALWLILLFNIYNFPQPHQLLRPQYTLNKKKEKKVKKGWKNVINYMIGSLCMLSEDGMQCSQRPRWSHGKAHTQLWFLKRLDAILCSRRFFVI